MNNKNSTFTSFLKSKNTKAGALATALTVFVVAAVILLNVVVNTLSVRYSLYADMTSNDAYRLNEASAEFASSVKKSVDVYILANESVFEGYGDYYVQANRLIRQLCESSKDLKLSYVDLTTHPTFVSAYPDVDWSASHLCLVSSGSRYRVIDAEDMFDYELDSSTYSYVVADQHIEQAVCAAILNVTSDSLTTVSVLTGQSEEDMSPFTELLTNNAYNVETVDLSTGRISDASDFLIIYAPAVDIDDDMLDYLTEWLGNDGDYGRNLIYFPTDTRDVAEFPNLNALIGSYGMSVSFGYIYESDATYISSSLNTALCSRYNYADSTFTEDLPNSDIPVFLYYTMPVNITDQNLARPLLTSSEKAFFGPMTNEVDDDFTPDQHVYNGAAVGTVGNGSTDDPRESHVIVIGSYDCVSEGFLKYNAYNNSAYFINIFNTLSDSDNTGVIIEGKQLSSTALGAGSAASVGFIGVIVRYLIPAAVLIAGVAVFLLRRHR